MLVSGRVYFVFIDSNQPSTFLIFLCSFHTKLIEGPSCVPFLEGFGEKLSHSRVFFFGKQG